MIRLVETFKEFIDTASISQGPSAWTIYGTNPEDLSQVEKISFPEFNIKSIEAKIDTSIDSTIVYAHDIKIKNETLYFWINSPDNILAIKDFKKVKEYNSNDAEEKYQISTTIKFKNTEFKILVFLVDRNYMKYPCMLGRNFIEMSMFKVDLNQ